MDDYERTGNFNIWDEDDWLRDEARAVLLVQESSNGTVDIRSLQWERVDREGE